VSFPELILFGNWNFKFKEDEIDENYIGGCLQSSKLNTISNCEEFFHLRFQPIQMGDGQLDAMVECLKAKEFVLIELDTKQITWGLNQDIFMQEHYCLIQGIDTDCEVLYVMDTNAVDHNQSVIPFSNLSMIKRMWKIDMSSIQDCSYSSNEMIKMLLKRMKADQVLEQEFKYLNYLKNHTIDMKKEAKGYEDKMAFCPFMWNLYNLGTGRYQTSMLIDHLIQSENRVDLKLVSYGLIELAKSWEDIRNLLIKYAIKGNKVIYQRVVVHTEETVEKEKQIHDKMGEYIDENK
jgi:hypothetical protein